MAVGLGEDERFRNLGAAGKYLRPLVPEGADDGANLVRVDDGTVQFLAGIDDGLVLNFPALAARQALALLDLLVRPELAAALGAQGVDGVDFVADVDTVGDGLLMAVFADDVCLKEPVGAVVRGGRQADEIGVEVFQDLAPQVVNRAVAFVDDDEIEELGRNFRVVDDRHGLSGLHHFRRVDFFGGLVHVLVPQQRVHALDGADAHLAVPGDVGRPETLDVVEFGELAVVVAGHVGHEFLLGLFAQVPGVDEEEDALGVGVLEQSVDRGDGGVGLARAGGHLNEGARAVVLEGRFEPFDGVHLARSQTGRVQGRQSLQPGAQGGRLRVPFLHRLRSREMKHLPRTRLRVARVGKPRQHAGTFVHERQRF